MDSGLCGVLEQSSGEPMKPRLLRIAVVLCVLAVLAVLAVGAWWVWREYCWGDQLHKPVASNDVNLVNTL